MLLIAVSGVSFMVLTAWMHPRVTTFIDRRLTLAHLHPHPAAPPGRAVTTTRARRPPPRHTAPDTPEEILESLLRDVRAGVHPRDALIAVARRAFPDDSHHNGFNPHAVTTMPEFLELCADHARSTDRHAHAEMFRIVRGCLVTGAIVPAAVENAIVVVRTRAMLHAELRTATSQATLTVRILSLLPFGALLAMAIFSSGFRHTVTMPVTLVVIVIGVGVNRVGAWWTRMLVRRAVSMPEDDITALTEHLAVSLHAGVGITEALVEAHSLSPTAAEVSNALAHGHRMEDALALLPATASAMRLTHTLRTANRDGLPVAATVHQLVNDAHDARRRHVEASIRRLPTALAFPVVLCTLPSFLLITVAPMMLGALGQLAPLVSPRNVPFVPQGVS